MADDAASYGSREHMRRRARGSQDTSLSTDGMYRAGQPIGFLAARGTPYEKKYLTKKLGFCCTVMAPPIVLVTLVLALVPIVWAIANHTLHVAQLHVLEANLTSITNTSFPLSLNAQVTKSGIFPATLYFRSPVDVYWRTVPTADEPTGREVHLGQMKLGRVNAAAGHAKVLQNTQFDIIDGEAFREFAKFLITEPEFTWYLRCPNVHAEAFGFLPTFRNYDFKKTTVLKGFDNFHNVKILDFQLPGNDPEGGITAQVLTSMTNPSPFSVQLGSLNLDLYYKDLYLGPAATAGNVNVTSGVNTVLLKSRLISHADNSTALGLLGEVFTGYINGYAVPVVAKGVSTKLANGETIGWLSEGIKALVVQVPLQSPEPINPIKGIDINYLSLVFDKEQPWAPVTYSNALSGAIGLPFGFSLNIIQTSNSINLIYDNTSVALINGAFSNSTTELSLVSAGQTAGTLDLTLPPTRLQLPGDTDGKNQTAHDNFITFQKALIFNNNARVQLQGSSKALTDTPIGRVLLNGIKFDVGSGLTGLDSLTRYPTEITSVDVVGGTSEALQLVVGTTLVNPSNLNLTTGDTSFQLSNEVALGTVTLPNFNLKIGRNDVNATSKFNPNIHPKGLETLNRFISGLNTNLNITGFSGSSDIVSLNSALQPIKLNATLPGLQHSLVQAAHLTVLDTTGITDTIANAVVQLSNPFTSGLTITRISSKVYSHGIFLAQIDTSLNFPAAGKAVTSSPNVPLALNLYPPDIFGALRAFAVQAGLNPAYIDGIVALGGFTLTPATNIGGASITAGNSTAAQKRNVQANEGGAMADLLMSAGSANLGQLQDIEDEATVLDLRGLERPQKRDNMYTNFDLPSYVAAAFKVAKTDLEIVSDAVIGEYGTTLTFAQYNVPLGTDDTLFKLLPVLAQPIVQKIVDGAILNVDRATVINPQQNSFTAALQGALTQAGPFDGTVEFTKGLKVNYQGRLLGQIAMPNISLIGDVGSTLDLTAPFAIADVDFMQQFTTDALHNPTFVWNIAAEGITAHALGISVPNITLSKDVILNGFNGLKGDVVVNSFDLPSNDPAGGIHLTVNATINNPAQVGVQLSRFGTMISSNGTELGPSAAANEFILQALAQTNIPLVGRLQQQTAPEALNVLSTVFTNVVHDQATTLQVAGQYAGPKEVTWLNNAIKTLVIDISLPSVKFQVIKAVSLNQLSLAFTPDTAWAPPTSTVNTTAPFYLPFAFPVDIKQTTGKFIANYNGQDAAVLDVPNVPTKTDIANRILTLAFNNVPFAVYDNAHSTFSQFLADTTAKEAVTFNLHGTASAQTSTAAGVVTISDIPFNVDSTILGLQNFNARPALVSNLDVVHGYPDYLKITLDTALYNPSDITISVGDVNFNTLYTEHVIGQALIKGLQVVPGTNVVPTELDYKPQGSANVAAGQTVLENYIQNISTDAVVAGTRQSTPVSSLQQALAGVALTAAIPPLNKLLVTEAILEVPKNIGQSPIASAAVVLANPFTATLNIEKIDSSPQYNDLTLGRINVDLSKNPIVALGHETTQSQMLPITLNTKPKSLVKLVFELAQATGVSLGPWPPLFQEIFNLPGDASTQVQAYPDSLDTGCHLGNQFDLLGAVLESLKGLKSRIPVASGVHIDQYFTNLNFVQYPVPVKTDETALYLLGPAGAPLIQVIVDQAGLQFTQANATHLTDQGFQVSLRGSLSTNAPANALIEFTEPLQIAWQGKNIAEITLPPICTIPGVGVPNLETTGQLRITNQGAFTEFASFILHNPSFTWTISSDVVVVRALQITYSKVKLKKDISLDVFNGLPGVTVSNFDIYGETANSLLYTTDSKIPSPSALGVELGTATFHISFQGTYLGPASAYDLFLLPKAVTSTVLKGEIVKQTSANDLANVGILFSRFLAGLNSTLTVQGWEVVSPYQSTPIKWLSDAFQTLFLDVALQGKIYEIISSIVISDLTVFVNGPTSDAYNVPTSNNQSIATFANPFMFTLTPVKAGPDIIINFNNVDTAELKLPLDPVKAGTSTGPKDPAQLLLTWTKQRIRSLNNGAFESFFAKLTDTSEAVFDLKGTTSVVANTHIGQLTITGIPINVTSRLDGINSFGHTAPLKDVSVAGSTPSYIKIPLTVGLNNPSHLTIYTREVYIPSKYQGVEIGRAYVAELSLLPGMNEVPTEFRYAPANPNDATAMKVIELYLEPANNGANGGNTPQTAPITIGGVPQTSSPPASPYGSLIPALEGVTADASLPGIGARLVTHIDVFIDLVQSLATNKVQSSLTIANPLPAGMTINTLDTDIYKAGAEPTTRAQVQHAVFNPPFTIGGKSSAVSTKFDVLLTYGTLLSLDLIGHPLSTSSVIGTTVEGGYFIPALHYNLYDIPTSYSITALGGVIDFKITNIAALLQQLLDFANTKGALAELQSALGNISNDVLQKIGGDLNLQNPVTQQVCKDLSILGNLAACKSITSAVTSSSSSNSSSSNGILPLVGLTPGSSNASSNNASSNNASSNNASSSNASSSAAARR